MELLQGVDLTNLSYQMLFVWLLLYTTKRSEYREDKLSATLSEVVPTLDKINSRLDIIEDKLDNK